MAELKTFKLTIARVHELLYTGDAHVVTLPGTEGELTVLAKHEPLITRLKSGTITVRDSEGEKKIQIEKGLLETSNGQVTVLV